MAENLPDDIFRLAPDAMLIFDDEGVIFAANEQAGILLGVPEEQMAGRNLAAFGPPGWDPRPGIHRLLHDGRARDEFRLMRDGELIDVEYSSRARIAEGRHLTVIRDTSESKRRERSLRESEELFGRAFFGAPAALSVSGEHGRFLLVNERFIELTGYWRSDVIGRSAADLRLWADADQRARAESSLQGGTFVPCFRALFRAKNGDTREMLVCLSRVQVQGQSCVVTVAFEPEPTPSNP